MTVSERDLCFTHEWIALWRSDGASHAEAEQLLAILRARYSEPWRAFHIWDHVLDLYDRFLSVVDRLHDPQAVFLAIAYHDASYDPLSSQKERLSACLARADLVRFLGMSHFVARVCTFIEASHHHLVPADLPAHETSDLSYFLDMDLSGLGASWERYIADNTQVRAEYPQTSHADFITESSAVLGGFAQRSPLYHTEYFRSRYEASAQANLQRTLAGYRRGKMPAELPA